MQFRTMGNHWQNCSDRSDRSFLDQWTGRTVRLPQRVQMVCAGSGSWSDCTDSSGRNAAYTCFSCCTVDTVRGWFYMVFLEVGTMNKKVKQGSMPAILVRILGLES